MCTIAIDDLMNSDSEGDAYHSLKQRISEFKDNSVWPQAIIGAIFKMTTQNATSVLGKYGIYTLDHMKCE